MVLFMRRNERMDTTTGGIVKANKMGIIDVLRDMFESSKEPEYLAEEYPLTVEVTKVEIRERMEGLFVVTLNLKCMNGETEKINQNFTENYRPGDTMEYIMGKFKEKMQAVINQYKSEQDVDTTLEWDTAISELQTHLEVEN